ncbi:MAG TPA: DUF3024 domain-containing protein [Acidimicrobiales bacterium]|nr:DUF3024 domain-containing protein [Acidimicrobiales bacterium]
MSDLPHDELARITAYCDARVPGELSDQVRVEARAKGRSVTVYEYRPPWRGERGPAWAEVRIAQLRFDPALDEWTLFWSDRDERWHRFEEAPAGPLEEVLDALERDPTGVFWG